MSTKFSQLMNMSLLAKKLLLLVASLIIGGSALLGFSNPAFAGDVNAGPIWNNDHAKQVCPRVCDSVGLKWNGNWFTNDPGKNSVCGCDSL